MRSHEMTGWPSIAGARIAGLGGVFRGKIWSPPVPPKVDSYADWMRSTKPRHGETNLVHETQARTHHSTIFWDVYSRLWDQKADVLVTHEAPSVHPHGVAAIDDLAKAMGVQATFHGHHHDSLDYRAEWDRLASKPIAWASAASRISTAASCGRATLTKTGLIAKNACSRHEDPARVGLHLEFLAKNYPGQHLITAQPEAEVLVGASCGPR